MLKEIDSNDFGSVISKVWTFAFFTMIFRDLHEMSTAGTINGILNGTFEGNPVTDAGLVAGGAALVVLLLTSLMSPLLKAKAARTLNLIAAPIALGGSFYIFPNDPDDYLLGAVTALAFLAIFLLALVWPTNASQPLRKEARDVL